MKFSPDPIIQLAKLRLEWGVTVGTPREFNTGVTAIGDWKVRPPP